ncbi:MAG TPA: helix-turn-helix transcriptional regulator [Nitrospirota bacterium]|nr:helix-turn-helix transcriptional regulator [Nitrospirota bacterium]
MKRKNIVGDNIRRLRSEAGITQEEVALRSGLSQGYINQLESGKRRFTQKSLELIAEALSVQMSDLFRGEEPSNIPVVKEETRIYGKKGVNKKEFLGLIKELPDHIVEHYFILMKLERELWGKGGKGYSQITDKLPPVQGSRVRRN